MATKTYTIPTEIFKGRFTLSLWPIGAPDSNIYFAEESRALAGGSKGSGSKSRLSWSAYVLEKFILKEIAVSDNATGETLIMFGAGQYAVYDPKHEEIGLYGLSDSDAKLAVTAAVMQKTIKFSKTTTLTKNAFSYFVSAVNEARAAISPSSGDVDKSRLQMASLFFLCDALYFEGKICDKKEKGVSEYVISAKELDAAPDPMDYDFTNPIASVLMGAGFTVPSSPTKATKAKSSATAKTMPVITKAMKGEFHVRKTWDPEQTQHIPDVSELEYYVPCEAFEDSLNICYSTMQQVESRMLSGETELDKVIGNDYANIILCGKPGTGKTTLASAVAASLHMPLYTVSMSKYSEEDTFEGKTKVSSGGFGFFETPFLNAYQNGGVVVLEEFNLISPGVIMGAIGQAIEKPFVLMRDGYSPVARNPLCIIICTMNTGTQGSQEPSEAFTSRCPSTFVLDDPKREDFINILVSRGHEKKWVEIVYSAYEATQTYLMSPAINQTEMAMSVTLRHCDAALRQIGIGIPAVRALKNTFYGVCAVKDLEIAKKLWENVLKNSRGL